MVGAKKLSEVQTTLKQKPAIIIKKQLKPIGQEGEEHKKKERQPLEGNSQITNLINRQNRRDDDSFDNGLDNLLDSSVDLSNIKQQTAIDKSKVREIMAKRRGDEKVEKVMGLNEPDITIRGNRNNENDDTMISSAVNKSGAKSKVRESEDDFDKLIGHIEGSVNKKQ